MLPFFPKQINSTKDFTKLFSFFSVDRSYVCVMTYVYVQKRAKFCVILSIRTDDVTECENSLRYSVFSKINC